MIEEIKKKYCDYNNIDYYNRISTNLIYDFGHTKDIPLFTIAIPTYKRTKLLSYALSTALNQKFFSDYEIIVVDNDPTDKSETETYMMQFKNHPNVAYYKNTQNIGMVGNWNKIYYLSRTKWVIMLDDDNLLYPDYLLNMSNIIKKYHDYDCFYCCYNKIYGNIDKLPKRDKKNIKILTIKDTDFLTGSHVHTPLAMAVKRDVIMKIGGFNPDFFPSQDLHYHAKVTHYFKAKWLRGYPLASYRWDVNESLKEETLFGWLKHDTKTKELILDNNHFIIFRLFFNIYIKYFLYLFQQNWYGKTKTIDKPSFFTKLIYLMVKFYLGVPKKLRKTDAYTPIAID